MKFFSTSLTAAVLVSAGLLLAASPVVAEEGSTKSAKVKKHRVKVAKLKPDEDRFLHGSRETQTMRDSRLTRECRGAANGGACRGYTR
jgi:hypothetical protein